MTTFQFLNFYETTLATSLSSSGTTITVSNATGLPSIPAGQMLPMILNDAATRAVHEIVYVTAIAGSNLTVIRGQEGTAAVAWLASDYIYADVTQASVAPVNGNPNNPFVVSNLTAATGVFGNVAVFLTTGATLNGTAFAWTNGGNWTVPSGVTMARVRVWGAGAGGAGSTSGSLAGGGGGGGGYAESVLSSLIPGSTHVITVGTAGVGGASGGVNGTNGGSSSFDSSVVATGGQGGSTGSGGPQGSGTAGMILMAGGHGNGGGATPSVPNGGACAFGGAGGAGSNGAGSAGSFPGGGGGGWGPDSLGPGQNGANGMIVVEY